MITFWVILLTDMQSETHKPKEVKIYTSSDRGSLPNYSIINRVLAAVGDIKIKDILLSHTSRRVISFMALTLSAVTPPST